MHKVEPIRVGILHSQKGSLASSEQPVANATRLALEELNANGGILGRPISISYADGASDPAIFAQEAKRLIKEQHVNVIFGCWSSASRKAVIPVLERQKGLLFFPLQYEGLEQSPRVVYTGAVPNQQMVPAIKWALDNLGKRFYLIGSDYIYPHAANTMAKIQIEALGGTVVGTEYVPLGDQLFQQTLDRIKKSEPEVILNTINGDSNQAFFKAIIKDDIQVKTLSLSASEVEFATMGKALPVGQYACYSYFQSVDSLENRHFVSRYKARFGADAVTSDPMEAAYIGVKLWAQAVKEAGSALPEEVLSNIGGQSIAAPEGLVSVDGTTLHCWKSVRIGRLKEDGQFDIVWSSQSSVRPRPYPLYRTINEWNHYLDQMHGKWGNKWIAPTS